MRMAVILSIALLAGCSPFFDHARVQSFAPGPQGRFTYSVQTNTVMTENADGVAERIRRIWLAQTLLANRECPTGYVIYSRELVQPAPGPFENGGDIVYRGQCL